MLNNWQSNIEYIDKFKIVDNETPDLEMHRTHIAEGHALLALLILF